MKPPKYLAKVEPSHDLWHIQVVYETTNAFTSKKIVVFDRYTNSQEVAEQWANEAIERHKEQRRKAERDRQAKLAKTKTWTVKGDL